MNTAELKQNFHQLIENINNDDILLGFYKLMKQSSTEKSGQLWSQLTPDEQNELLQSFAESENEENLISHEEMKRKHKKWL
jgi:predicted transcriptional regulator